MKARAPILEQYDRSGGEDAFLAAIGDNPRCNVGGRLCSGFILAVVIQHADSKLPRRHCRWPDSLARLGAAQED